VPLASLDVGLDFHVRSPEFRRLSGKFVVSSGPLVRASLFF
jgi:hypothetical protein